MKPTLLYSGGCKFCRWVVRTLFTSPRIDILPIRLAPEFFSPQMPIEERVQNWWWVEPGGVLLKKGPAIRALIQFFFGISLPTVLDPVLAWVDDWVKAHRPWLSSWVDDGPAILQEWGMREAFDWNLEMKFNAFTSRLDD